MTRRAAAALLAAAGAVGLALRADRVEVAGASMLPGLQPGDRLVVVPLGPRRGRLVVVADPRSPDRVLIKRVRSVGPDGVHVRGDNPLHSTDSRTFGPVPLHLVRGRPAYRYAPAGRAGWIAWD